MSAKEPLREWERRPRPGQAEERAKFPRFVLPAIIAIVVAVMIKSCALATLPIPTASMNPTLQAGDYLLYNKVSYGSGVNLFGHWPIGGEKPKKGDLVVLALTPAQSERKDYYVRRIAAGPGNVVEVRGMTTYVDGQFFAGPGEEVPDKGEHDGEQHLDRITLGADQYFVLADHSASGKDSREFGPISAGDICGKPVLVYWSWRKPGHFVWPNFSRIGRFVK
jgi:signal peptidase I